MDKFDKSSIVLILIIIFGIIIAVGLFYILLNM